MRIPSVRPRLAPITLACAAALGVPFPAALAQEGHHDHHEHPEQLGSVEFPVTCGEAAKPHFARGIAFLHSFGYEEAARSFREAVAADPECAMAHWGVAMSQFHPIWAPPTEAEHAAGLEAARRAAELGGRDERENRWIAMVGSIYEGGPTRPNLERAKAFEQAMAGISANYPEDPEATIFHALGLLSVAYNSPPDKGYPLQKRAASMLEGMLATHPGHPGIAHYVIHSFDYPALAELALPAARAYAKIAPDSPHALHMPSHIFTRLGLWPESIESNLASQAAAQRRIEQTHPGATSYDALHAMDYLAYAYLQTAQDDKALDVLDQVGAVKAFDVPQFAAGYALAAIPARHALERRDWRAAASLEVRPDTFPWDRYPYAEAIVHFARTVGASRLGEVEGARGSYERLHEIQSALAAGPKGGFDWASQVEIQRLAAEGWLREAEGKGEEAERLLRAAADLEDTTDKHPVTPGSILPAREQLADLLLLHGKPAEALREYRDSLATAPARYRSFAGAAEAAEKAGDPETARSFQTQLTSLCVPGAARPELAKARAAVAGR